MNFKTEFIAGQSSKNKGLPMGEGLSHIDSAIQGIQRNMTYVIGASPKCGKSTFVDYGFILAPYMAWVIKPYVVRWIYLSLEMDRISKEYDFATFFLHTYYGISEIQLPDGVFFKKPNGTLLSKIPLSSDYLRGRLNDSEGNTILCSQELQQLLIQVYEKHIITLFGEYDEKGRKIKNGLMLFVDTIEDTNPTGLYKNLLAFAETRGSFSKESYTNKEGVVKDKIIGYTPNDPEEYVIIITDTVRKLQRERGFTLKENIDKWVAYANEIRNLCRYTFAHIVHLNRGISDVTRLKFMGENLTPTPEDIKESGNKLPSTREI